MFKEYTTIYMLCVVLTVLLLLLSFFTIMLKLKFNVNKKELDKVLKQIKINDATHVEDLKTSGDTLDQLVMYRENFNSLLSFVKNTPMALLDNELRHTFEVKSTGEVICRTRIRKPVEKKIIKQARLVYVNKEKTAYIEAKHFNFLLSYTVKDIQMFFKKYSIYILNNTVIKQ